MNPRRPNAAENSSPLPSLHEATAEPTPVVVHGSLASTVGIGVGAALMATAVVTLERPPVCGQTRADELFAHGPVINLELGQGEASRAIREVLIATGMLSHDSTWSLTPPRTSGGISAVNPHTTPTPPTPERLSAPGEAPMVLPTPPIQPTVQLTVEPTVRHPPVATDGGGREVSVVPPQRPLAHPIARPGGPSRVNETMPREVTLHRGMRPAVRP